MTERCCLNDLKRGQKGVIARLTVCDDMRRRLQDMGLIEGTVVECVGKSPLGDPTAFLIRGAVIALRNEDSVRVLIQNKEQESYDPSYGTGIAAACITAEEEVWD
nr:FeoA family protein [uncultured Clostridium sp.]